MRWRIETYWGVPADHIGFGYFWRLRLAASPRVGAFPDLGRSGCNSATAYFDGDGIGSVCGPLTGAVPKYDVVHRYRRVRLHLIDRFLGQLGLQIFFNLGLGIVESLRRARGDLDDVIAELGFHRLADFAYRQRERRLVERRHHLAVLEFAQIAALCARARVVRFGFRQRGEIGARHELLANVLRLGQGLFLA